MSRNEGFNTAFHAITEDLYGQAVGKYTSNVERNIPRVPYILAPEVITSIINDIGYEFAADGTQPAPSDHREYATQRALIRNPYNRKVMPKTRRTRTLVVGATAREIAQYYSNPSMHFYIHGTEAKDIGRIMPLLEEALELISKEALPIGDERRSKAKYATQRATLKLDGLRDLLDFYEGVSGRGDRRTRIYTSEDEVEKAGRFGTLLFEDSAYNLSSADWFRWFDITRAHTAHVIGFYPHELLFEHKIPSRLSKVEFLEAQEISKWVLISGIIPALGANWAFWSGNLAWSWFLVKVAAVILKAAWAMKGEATVDKLMLVGTVEAERWLRSNDVHVEGVGSLHRLTMELLTCLAVKAIASYRTRKVRVTYKNGHSNGYTHFEHTWKALLAGPVLESADHNYVLMNEIRDRTGEMLHIIVSRSSVPEEQISRTISLPASEAYVEVLDVLNSFDFRKRCWSKPRYMKVKKREFYEVVNHLGRQDPKTHSIQATAAMISRAYVGVSIATVEYAAKWDADVNELERIAASTTIYAIHRAADAATVLEFSMELRKEATTRFHEFLRQIGEGIVSVVTLGLGASLWELYRYLMESKNVPVFVREPEISITQVWDPNTSTSLRRKMQVLLGITPGQEESPYRVDEEFDIVPRGAGRKPICPFTLGLGDLGEQDVRCDHVEGTLVEEVEVRFSAEKMAALRVRMVAERDPAQVELNRTLDQFIDELPMEGFTFKVQVSVLMGPFGTGKSYIVKKLLDGFIEGHEKPVVHIPFSKLTKDYSDFSEDGSKKYECYTTHKAIKLRGKDVFVVDEYTAMDEDVLLVSAFKAGARKIVLVGDEFQTGVMPTEGQRIFRQGSQLPGKTVPKHVLTKNFRNGLWAVAWANYFHQEQYCMTAKHTEHLDLPEIKPFAEHQKWTADKAGYSKLTCQAGDQDIGAENTIRKNQGQTLDALGILLQERDEAFLNADELNRVAFTRVRAGGKLVFFVDPGPVKTKLEQLLGFSDEYFMANVKNLAQGNIDGRFGTPESPKNDALQEYLESLLVSKQVWLGGKVLGEENTSGGDALLRLQLELEKLHQGDNKKKICACGASYVGQSSHCPLCVVCVVCGGPKELELYDTCSGCASREIDNDAENWEDLRADLVKIDKDTEFALPDFSADCKEYQFCLVRAVLADVEENLDEFSLRLKLWENVRGLRRMSRGPRPVREVRKSMVPAGKFLGLKGFLDERMEKSDRQQPIPHDIFASYLDSVHVEYLILEYDDNKKCLLGIRTNVKKLGDRTVIISTAAGHANPGEPDEYKYWGQDLDFWGRLPGGEKRRFSENPLSSIEDVVKKFPGTTFAKPMPGYSLETSIGLWAATSRGVPDFCLVRAAASGKIGGPIYEQVRNPNVRLNGTYANILAEAHAGPYVAETFGWEARTGPHRPETVVPYRFSDNLGVCDSYKFASLIDPSSYRFGRTNAVGAAKGPDGPLKRFRVDKSALWDPRKKNGNPVAPTDTKYAITAGYGLTQTTSNLETLGCVGRYFGRKRKTRPSVEGIRDARKMAKHNLKTRYDLLSRPDRALLRTVDEQFRADARRRNYDGRAESQFKANQQERQVVFSNKAQFKPAKNGKLNAYKVGQGISATSAATNLKFGSFFRQATTNMYVMQKPENIFDIYVDKETLVSQVNTQVAKLSSPRAITVDQEQCDANQNWHSREAEKTHWIETTGAVATVQEYFKDVRQDYPIQTYGLMSGKVDDPKPSGAVDTLVGNSIVTEMYGNRILTGKGRRTTVKKGDDFAAWQRQLAFNLAEWKRMRVFANIVQTVDHGTMEFCGLINCDGGLYPNPIRTARKVAAYRAKDYKQFATYQISLRDEIEVWKRMNVRKMCFVADKASKEVPGIAMSAMHFVYSMAHINQDQWREVVRPHTVFKPFNVAADGTPQWH